MHESDSGHHSGRRWRHAEANVDSVSEYTNDQDNATHLCIKIIELFRRPVVNFLFEVGNEAAEFSDGCVAAFPTW